mgnify:CR=1 FL=1
MPLYVAGGAYRRRRALWSRPSAVAVSTNTQSAHFDGVDDKVTAAAVSVGGAGTAYTVHCFINLDAVPASLQHWLLQISADNRAVMLSIRETGVLRFGVKSGATFPTIDSTTAPTTGTWYEIYAVRNAGTIKLGVNRSQEATTTFTDSDCSGGDFSIGENVDALMDDVRIFNVELNATNLALLTVANIGKKPSAITGWDTANAADTNQLRLYNFESPWSNATVNTANQVKDTGNDASNGTGVNFAGTAVSGVSTTVPS